MDRLLQLGRGGPGMGAAGQGNGKLFLPGFEKMSLRAASFSVIHPHGDTRDVSVIEKRHRPCLK